jgi:cation transport regulator ChaB
VAAFEYDDDPQRLDQYVSVDELTELIDVEGKPFRKDSKRLLHFLNRVRTTLLAFRQQIQHLHRDVQAANIRATSIGTPTSLDPRSAARFLPPEEIAALADELIKQKLAAIADTERLAAQERTDTVRRLNALKFAVSTVKEDYAIPSDVRARVAAAFDGVFVQHEESSAASPASESSTGQESPAGPGDALDDLFK